MSIIVAVFIICIYLVCPIVGKIALLIANTLLPDPIPYADEFIMWFGLFMHLSRLMSVAEFMRIHKKPIITGAIILLIIIILLFV